MRIVNRILLILGLILLAAGLYGATLWAAIDAEEVSFRSGGLTLRGTLLTPAAADPAPAVVLIHGSGEVTRKSMIQYAWLFALKGYAALAYDKRGLGASDGDPSEWREFSFDDLAADAAAAYAHLQTHPQIDAGRVGFFAASQGGWVASLAANRGDEPSFMIMASASLATVAEDRVFGRQAQVRHAGFDTDAVAEATALIEANHAATRSAEAQAAYERLWHTYSDRAWLRAVHGDNAPEPQSSPFRAWQKSILDFDPYPHLQRLETPTLWIFGDPDLDRFAPVALSMTRVAAGAASGACYRTLQIDDVGHTLEPHGAGMAALLKVRIPLVLDIYAWLDELDTMRAACQAHARRLSVTRYRAGWPDNA